MLHAKSSQVFVKPEAFLGGDVHSMLFMNDEEYDALLLTRPGGVKRGDFKVPLRAMNGSRAWLKHLRGVGFEDATAQDPGKRLLCHGLPAAAQCEHVPVGLQCRGELEDTTLVNPSNAWVDERPYRLMATRLGDIFAGSYDTPSWGGAV